MRIRILFLALVVVAHSGCAFGTRHVNLTHPVTSFAPVSSKGSVVVAEFADGRIASDGAGSTVGHVRNGYGMKTAEVVTTGDPVRWVNDGIAQALAQQGFEVHREVSDADPAVPAVHGTVTKINADTVGQIEGSIGVLFRIEQNGEERFSGLCSGSSSAMGFFAASGEYESVLNLAMEKFLSDCTPKLTAALVPIAPARPATSPVRTARPSEAAPSRDAAVVAPSPRSPLEEERFGRCYASTVREMRSAGISDQDIREGCQIPAGKKWFVPEITTAPREARKDG